MTEPPADISPPPATPPGRSRDRGEWLVATVLAAVSACVLFSDLGAGRMEPDESLYALATDHLRAGGDWLTLSPHPPALYFNKPPLYVWLSALTYGWVPGFELKYRFWSALFGAAAVAGTGALGTRLYRPTVGLIAGLLLLTNRSFLLDHGARFGGMDAALTACSVAVLWLYWVGRTTARGVWPWACIGLAAGLASLLKPVAGIPLLAVIGVHAVLTRRAVLSGAASAHPDPPRTDGGRSPPYAVPAVHAWLAVGVVLVVAAAVAVPWYWINHQRFPDGFARQMFGHQLADTLANPSPDDEVRPWHFYWLKVPASSTLWALVVPAAGWAAVTAVRDARRRPILLLLLIAGLGWVAGFSVPQKKFLHYAYPAFPALAVMMAACLADVLGHLARRTGGRLRSSGGERFTSGGLRAAVAGLLGFAGYLALVALPREASPLPTWTVYKAFEPAIRDGRADLLVWGVPHRPDAWPDERLIRPNHMVYLSHMTGAQVVRDAADLAARLANGRPALIVLSRDQDLSSLPALHPGSHRVDERYTVEQRPYTMLAVDSGSLLAPTLRPGEPTPYLSFVRSGAHASSAPASPASSASPADRFGFDGGTFVVRVTAPLPAPSILTLMVRSADGQPRRRVRCVATGGGREPVDLQPMDFAATHRVAVLLDGGRPPPAAARDVRVTLVPVDGGPAGTIAGELVEAVLHVAPAVPGNAATP